MLFWAAVIAGALAAWYAVCAFLHRVVFKTGLPRRRRFAKTGITHWVLEGDLGVDLVHREMFIEDAYFQHGVVLDRTKCPFILDVGANVGLFALSCAMQCSREKGGKGCEIHSFEPIPLLCEVAQRNASDAMKDALNRITLHNVALGTERGETVFDFNPGMSAGATMFPTEVAQHGKTFGLLPWVRAVVHDTAWSGRMPTSLAKFILALLGVPVLCWIVIIFAFVPFSLVATIYFLASPTKAQPVKVKLDVLSDILDEVERKRGGPLPDIDFLKVDVEGAEWIVLQGLRDDHWKKVQQCVIEVHNIDGRVDKVKKLLREKGFLNVVQGVEGLLSHELLDLHTIFATRRQPTK